MKLIQQWEEMARLMQTEEDTAAFWGEYYEAEKNVYKSLIEEKKSHLEGAVKELAAQYGMEPVIFAGFLDGINTSLEKELDINELEEETAVSIDIDWKKLLFNMHKAKAKWLYTLPEWNNIFTEAEQKAISKEFLASVTAVSNKVGRNEPCPCGSGKKYKHCCGNV